MPSIALSPITITITAAALGSLTCASTAGLYVGQKGWATKSDGSGNINVVISSVINSTTFLCQTVANKNNSGGADLSLYNGGKVYFDAQVVSVETLYPTLDSNGDIPAGSLPLATASAQGAMPATEYAKTAAITLAQAQDVGAGSWPQRMRDAMRTYAPGVSNFSALNYRDGRWIGGAYAKSTTVPGSGVKITGDQIVLVPDCFLNPKTTPWAVAFRGAFPVPLTGRYTGIAVLNATTSQGVSLEAYYDVSVPARTKLMFQIYAGGANLIRLDDTIAIDRGVHDYLIACDMTNVTFHVDGVLGGTIAIASILPTASLQVVSVGHTSPMELSDLMIGW